MALDDGRAEDVVPEVDTFQQLIDTDVDGLLDLPDKPTKVTSSDRLERAFLEIVQFHRTHGRLPSPTTREISERKLGARLDGILADDTKIDALAHLDELGMLQVPEAPGSIEELLDDDPLGLLADESGILDVSGLPVRRQHFAPDDIARRRPASGFAEFAPLFTQKHAELRDGIAQLMPYPGVTHIAPGAFFVLNGVMLFVAEVGETEYKKSTVRDYKRERLRCVFENGTESRMLRQSLAIRLGDEDGQIVAPRVQPEILTDDEVSGYIYVLRSLSADPLIAGIDDLHKIGFSRGPVETRIKNAEKSPTYLMAPVVIVATYRVYNVRAAAVEGLLHRVFAEVRLNLTQVDSKGRNYDPSEWFCVPRTVIDQAVELITSGEIVRYQYDRELRRLIERTDI